MTSDEHDQLHNICEDYWKEFSQLVAKHLGRAPHHLQDQLLLMIEDRSSAHGSDFTRYMKRPPPFVEKFRRTLKKHGRT
jgi:hypothetical protein